MIDIELKIHFRSLPTGLQVQLANGEKEIKIDRERRRKGEIKTRVV